MKVARELWKVSQCECASCGSLLSVGEWAQNLNSGGRNAQWQAFYLSFIVLESFVLCVIYAFDGARLKPSFKQPQIRLCCSLSVEKANKSANEPLDQQWKWVRAWNKFRPLGTNVENDKNRRTWPNIIAPSGTSELLPLWRQTRQTNLKRLRKRFCCCRKVTKRESLDFFISLWLTEKTVGR